MILVGVTVPLLVSPSEVVLVWSPRSCLRLLLQYIVPVVLVLFRPLPALYSLVVAFPVVLVALFFRTGLLVFLPGILYLFEGILAVDRGHGLLGLSSLGKSPFGFFSLARLSH